MSDTRLVAILNITPDSFSDGGVFFKPDDALAAIARLITEGADVIDIGAESTRPGATPLSAEEEWARLEPVLSQIPRFAADTIAFSLDTRHADNARKALGYGVHWINDVSGFADASMVDAVKSSRCKLVVMHSLTVPADKSVVLPESADVVEELLRFARVRLQKLEKSGISRDRMIFDPGIGFGKTAKQSLDILRRIEEFNVLGVPLLVGHSRKSFLSEYHAGVSMSRDEATLEVSQLLMKQGVAYLRVHDVVAHTLLREEMEQGA